MHANLAFRISEDPFFLDYIHHIRPSCDPATRYVISHSILDSEAARVQLHEMDLLATRRNLTFLIDGWEDELRRSLYGSVAAQVNEYPSMLALEDMTGKRATAENVLVVMKNALRKMGLDDGRAFIALVTDNPTTMQAFRRLASSSGEFKWLLVSRFSLISYSWANNVQRLSPASSTVLTAFSATLRVILRRSETRLRQLPSSRTSIARTTGVASLQTSPRSSRLHVRCRRTVNHGGTLSFCKLLVFWIIGGWDKFRFIGSSLTYFAARHCSDSVYVRMQSLQSAGLRRSSWMCASPLSATRRSFRCCRRSRA